MDSYKHGYLLRRARRATMCSIMEDQAGQGEKTARIYELGYHIVPTVSEEAVATEVTALKDVLAGFKTQIIAEGFPRFRYLAYLMRQTSGGKQTDFSSAYFGWLKFETYPEAAQAIAAELRKNEKILRFLLFKTVRESTLSALRAPRAGVSRTPSVIPRATAAPIRMPVSETELEKSLEKIIAE